MVQQVVRFQTSRMQSTPVPRATAHTTIPLITEGVDDWLAQTRLNCSAVECGAHLRSSHAHSDCLGMLYMLSQPHARANVHTYRAVRSSKTLLKPPTCSVPAHEIQPRQAGERQPWSPCIVWRHV
jgi:hypothetical protein